MLTNTQNLIILNKGNDLKKSKTGLIDMADRQVLVQVKKIVGKFDIGQFGCWTSLVQHFGSSKISDK